MAAGCRARSGTKALTTQPVALILLTRVLAKLRGKLHEKGEAAALRNLRHLSGAVQSVLALVDADTRIESSPGIRVIRPPEHHRALSPILQVVPDQLLAYHTACVRGTDVDKPRNLAPDGQECDGGVSAASLPPTSPYCRTTGRMTSNSAGCEYSPSGAGPIFALKAGPSSFRTRCAVARSGKTS